MKWKGMSDEAVLEEIGGRIARYRLNRNMTQAALATEAGVSVPTVQRAEAGRSIQGMKLLRILRVLGLLENLDALIPEPAASPLQQWHQDGRVRQRASGSGQPSADAGEEWTWGEDA